MLNVAEMDGAVTFEVRVVPRASRSEFAGEYGGALKVRVASPPVDGAANNELIRFLARQLGIKKTSIEIVAGATSRSKRIRITGITAEELRRLFGA